MGDNDSEQFLQKIVSSPRETQWRNPHDVQLEKLSSDSLGLVLKTCQVPRLKETWTIVIEVKDNCLRNPSSLELGSRVTKINGCDITKSNSSAVSKILKSCKNKKGALTLRVYDAHKVPFVDAHVESQRLLNPLLDPSNNSSISSLSGLSPSEDINLESIGSDQREKKGNRHLQLKTSRTSGNHSWYTSQSSNRSLGGSDLTPVETPEAPFTGGCSEATPLMAFSHVGGPSSLGTDAENVDVGKAAVQNPCNIKWQINTEKITLLKTGKDEKVGFYYKIKKASGSSELFFLVERVDVGSPAHGKLHLGDWIRSVNGTPITDNKDILKQEIKRSVREVTLVIQRPESILRPTSAVNGGKNQQNKKKSVATTPTVAPTTKGWTESSPPGEGRIFTDVTETALDDIKIDGMSVYKGVIQSDPFSDLSNKPTIVITDSTRESRIESFISRDFTPGPISALNGTHRRNYSDPNVAVSNRTGHSQETVSTNPPASSSQEVIGSDSVNCALVTDCIKHIVTKDLQRRPYFRINQISTSTFPHFSVTARLLKEFGVKDSMLKATNHVFSVSQSQVTEMGSRFSRARVEEFVTSKLMADAFKCKNASVQEVKKALLDSKNKLLQGCNSVIENFMQSPPALDSDFIEVEVKNFIYEDILKFWPSVHFTMNSVYILVFDYNLFVIQPQEEVRKLQMCINFIHSSSCTTKIFVLCDNYPIASPLDTIMTELSILENSLKSKPTNSPPCSDCACDRTKILADAFSQIQENETSGQVYFLANRDSDWNSLSSSVRQCLCSVSKFPVSAILATKLLRQEETDAMTTTTMTYFKQNIMQQILPGLSEREALTALHQSGKICWHSQVAHRTVHSNAHNMFILLTPDAIRESVHSIQLQIRQKSSYGRRLTHSQVLHECLLSLKYKDKEELLMFLELYHILEAVKASEPQSEYYLVPQLMDPATNLRSLVKWYMGSSSNGSHCQNTTVFVDFHGLLPVNMCTALLARLCEVFGTNSQIKSVYTGCFESQGIKLMLQLVPYYSKAIVLATSEDPSNLLPRVVQLLTASLGKAVSSNLLTYHIGPASLEHMTEEELLLMLDQTNFDLLAQKVQVIDVGEMSTNSGLPQAWNRVNHGTENTNGVFVGVDSSLREIPISVEDVLCKGLNFRMGWKYLLESFGVNDWKLEDEFGRSANPTKSLLTYLKTSSTCTLKDVVKLLRKKQRLDVLQDLTDIGVNCDLA